MKISNEVIKWLKDNAYAVRNDGKVDVYWLLRDFPVECVPDKLHIPISKRSWQEINNKLQSS